METRVIEVPAHYKRLIAALRRVIETASALESRTRHGRAVEMLEIESISAQAAAEVERSMLGEFLSGLDVDAPRVMIGGREHARVGRYEMTYHTMPGPVVVERSIDRPRR